MRESAFRGTWQPNQRPYLTITPDVFVSLQGETSVIACGECRREVNFNHYVTSVSTEASVDSPPGSATITLSIPDNDVNDFYVEGQLIIIPMMEVEIYAKGYFSVGGVPQYYRIFWGLVSSVTKSWSNGSTTVQISCKDILRWWELTYATLNPAFLESFGGTANSYQLFGNQFANMNPYAVIAQLAHESMGDFSLTVGSLNDTTRPEKGEESGVIGSYAKDMMGYWQLKFQNIWNNLVMYGSSGRTYTFNGPGGTVSPLSITESILKEEEKQRKLEGAAAGTKNDDSLKVNMRELAAYKLELPRAGDVEFFQTEQESKLSIAMTARDQAGYEFYCDTTGDIVFKPPFYNLNVLPNKPVSWVQDFEIIDDSITDSEAEVYTHITSSGNAFSGGAIDLGLNDDYTTPKTGAYDFHLLRRYGWRHLSYQAAWANNSRQLFYHLIDYLDRVNAKRQNGTVTIPMRPELRMGFPIWIPRYDAFFYIQGISHQFSVGGQATTTLTLIAKRSKFIAPTNIGKIEQQPAPPPAPSDETGASVKKPTAKAVKKPGVCYNITFPSDAGVSSGLSQGDKYGQPAVIRDPKTGKLLGFPNAVMVFSKAYDGDVLAKIDTQTNKGTADAKKATANATKGRGNAQGQSKENFVYEKIQGAVIKDITSQKQAELVQRLRAHRYEAGMTNAGAYDYAWDAGGNFKELSCIPVDAITWSDGSGPSAATAGSSSADKLKQRRDKYANDIKEQQKVVDELGETLKDAKKDQQKAQNAVNAVKKKLVEKGVMIKAGDELPAAAKGHQENLNQATARVESLAQELKAQDGQLKALQGALKSLKIVANLSMMVRPVSDEFGFEVIGHYRYGRGAFIDRGKITVANGSTTANEVHVQFAAAGGLLDGPTVSTDGPMAQTFSQAFEDMRPEDYVTGASFDHGAGPGDVSNITVTSQSTYDDQIRNARLRQIGSGKNEQEQKDNSGFIVFAEADAIRRGRLLSELKPTLSIGGFSGGFEKCGCALGKTDWLSVLPQTALDQILKPTAVMGSFLPGNGTDVNLGNGRGEVRHGNAIDLISTSLTLSASGEKPSEWQAVNFESFFSVLNKYLVERFSGADGIKGAYSQNAGREQDATALNLDLTDPNYDAEDNNILGDPSDSLFNAAANGDPAALEALKNKANFNFGMTKKAADSFGDNVKNRSIQSRANRGPTQDGLLNPNKFGNSTGAYRSGDPFPPFP